MRIFCFLFAFLFLFFQVQASPGSMEEATQEHVAEAGQIEKTKLKDSRGDDPLPRSSPINDAESCKMRSGLCRNGMCPWKETKVGKCAFAKPCCKRNHL
ncbi:defensin-B5-like [Dromiciops gliroides]|uniref:defensin-B5-like n=1 Tax=Dromiciops gliroides TaxID=33562 RepID=UPI001CC67931|nr:defensin-B5-like [Dromiciops gliroides]